MLINDEEKKIIAYHECGHALVGKLLPNTDPVHKVTVIPRGMALGVTFSLPKQDQYIRSKNYYLDRICMSLGGRAAEMLTFQETYSGASSDISTSSEIARKMVCEWGMSEELGPIAYGKKDQEIFLGREIAQHRDYSDETARKIDAEVNKVIETQFSRAYKLLEKNLDKLEALTLAVIEHELLDGDEIDRVLAGEKLVNTKKPRIVASWRKKRKPPEGEVPASAKPEDKTAPAVPPAGTAPTEPPPENPDVGKKLDTQG
jgi:cell division protease FtsH